MSISLPLEQVYVLQERIGRGSFGQVYKGINKQSGQIVAIKVLDLESKEEDIDVIQREIFLLQRCDSEYITRYHASYLQGTNLCVVMDYAKGGSLRDILRSGAVEEIYISIVIREVLHALCYLHKSGIIHRDIKAANVLLTEEGKVKLCDFGVAGQFSVNSLKRHSFVGTPFWMAPEVMKRTAYDFKADIWSLGITTFEIATGGPPHMGRDPMRVVLISDFKEIQLPDSFSASMKEFMMHCLNEDPKLRPLADELLRTKWIRNAPKGVDLLLHLVARHNEWQSSQGEASSCKTAISDEDGKFDKQGDEWNFDSIPSVQHSGKSSPSNWPKILVEAPVVSTFPAPSGSSLPPAYRKGHRRNQSSIIQAVVDSPVKSNALKVQPPPPSPGDVPKKSSLHSNHMHRSSSESNITSDSPLIKLFDTASRQPSINSHSSKESAILSEWKTSPSLPFIIDTTVLTTLSDEESKPFQTAVMQEATTPRRSRFFSRSRAMDSRVYKPIQLITSALKKDTYEEILPLRPRSSTAPEFREPVDPNLFVNTVNRLSFLLNFTTRRKLSPSNRRHRTESATATQGIPPSVHSDESPLSFFEKMRSASVSTYFNPPKSSLFGSIDRPFFSLDRLTGRDLHEEDVTVPGTGTADAASRVPATRPFSAAPTTAGVYHEIVNRPTASEKPVCSAPAPSIVSAIHVQSLGELQCPDIVGRPDVYIETESAVEDRGKAIEEQLQQLCDTCWHWLDMAEQHMRRIAIIERKA